MKIVFFGSPQFSVPFLNQLITSDEISVVAVVTQPDKPVGRKATITSSPVAEAAQTYEIPVLKPKSLKKSEIQNEISSFGADAYVVVAYGKFLPDELLNIPRLGTINVHPSLLPIHRGATPMQSAILAGDDKTGITVMKMDAEMDHGPILAQLEFPLEPDVDYPTLENEVAYKGPPLLVRALLAYSNGRLTPTEQEHDRATYTTLFDRDTGKINWKKPAAEIERMLRALRPWPGVWTVWQDKRLKILDAEIAPSCLLKKPGAIIQKGDGVLISSKKGCLKLKSVQLEGSKPMSIEDFLQGHSDFVGSLLK